MKKDKTGKNFLDKPYYAGGNQALRAFVDEHLVYPDAVLKEGVKGTVVIRYTINHKGVVIEAKVLSGIGHGCNEAAQAVVRKLQFQVGNYRNIRVLFHKTIKIHFRAKAKKKKSVPVTVPQQAKESQSLQYSITPSTTKSSAAQKPKSPKSYSYTIKIG